MSQPRSVWTEGIEPGRQAVLLGVAVTLSVVAIDLGLTGRLSMFFDLCFITLCLGLALVVRPHDFFSIGVLPPLLMGALCVFLAILNPGAIADPRDGFVQAVVSGLAHHSAALVASYAVCLVTLTLRQRSLRARGRDAPLTGDPDERHLIDDLDEAPIA